MVAKYPAIPEPTLKPESLRDSILSIKQAFEVLTGQRGNPDYAAVTGEAFPDLAAPWRVYAPVISPSTGAFTTASALGRYRLIGKTTFLSLNILITTNGTGAGFINVSLPNTAGAYCVLAGREINVVGFMQQLILTPGQSIGAILKYDNTYPGGNGYRIIISGVYEAV